jgi:hypothetical protein
MSRGQSNWIPFRDSRRVSMPSAHLRNGSTRRDRPQERAIIKMGKDNSEFSDMRSRPFQWNETASEIESFEGLQFDSDLSRLIGPSVEVRLPAVVVPDEGPRSVEDYVDALPLELGLHLVVLMQAGAASLGLFENGTGIASKTIKKYVVRGRGKAQPTHLKTRGKSRYGSRLRLQNAKGLVVDVNHKLREWLGLFGRPESFFYNCPVRLWPTLFAAGAAPTLSPSDPWRKIPLDLPVPNTEVMLRTYGRLCTGFVDHDPTTAAGPM